MGQMRAEFEIKDGKAVGSMTMGGQTKPINADLGGALFADGTGSHSIIANLAFGGKLYDEFSQLRCAMNLSTSRTF